MEARVRVDLPIGNHQATGEARSEVIIVGDHDDGTPLLDELFKYFEDCFSREGIQTPGGFVGYDDRGVISERTSDGNALVFARQRCKPAICRHGLPAPPV